MNTVHAIFLGGAPLYYALALIGIFVYLNRDNFAKANKKVEKDKQS